MHIGAIGRQIPAILGSLFLFSLAACNVCENQTLATVPSPDKLKMAFLYARSCGATTGIGTEVSILPINEKLKNESGNLFIADSDHGRIPTLGNGELNIRMQWLSNNRLLVAYPKGARVFRSQTVLGPVQIDYQDDL